MTKHVEFIKYTGDYPHLCTGILTLKIDGTEYKFGNKFGECNNFKRFWRSGGSCGFMGDNYSDSYIEHDSWVIDADMLPAKIHCYADEIAKIFNENVEQGCCGGCL